jgi:WD40 repeat protein/nucleoside phosphorylase/DNA polymerase III delta prime subunit
MSDAGPLSTYFATQSVKRLKLEGALGAHVERIVALLDQETGQAKVSDVHEALFPFSSAASANKSLNSVQRQLNELAEKRGNPLRMRMTTAKSGGASRRFVWFEGPASAPPPTRTEELDSIPRNLLVDNRGTDPGAPVVVLITYNEHESDAVTARFSPGGPPPTEARQGRSFSLLGNFHGWRLVHLVSRQGEDHSQLSTGKAIAAWEPAAVIGVGIAFGVDAVKQDIGDVLVSESIQGYDLARVNLGGSLTPRDTGRPASGWLLQRIDTCQHHLRGTGHWPTLHFGVVLSGNKLVDDLDYRDSLVNLFPQGIVGGEMEGVGLAIAADDAKVHWIVVKGICDWADGKKNTISKDRDQRLAADNAVAVVAEALSEGPHSSTRLGQPDDDGGCRPRLPRAPSARLMGMKDTDTIEPRLLIDAPLGMPSTMDKDDPAPQRALGYDARALDVMSQNGGGVDVMTALHAWVDETDAPPVFAVLGEYGMGKTVTAQRLARELEAKHQEDPTRPAVLYFDLRSVTGLDKGVPTLAQTVEECMARSWIADEDPAAYTWSNVLAWLTAGVVVILDGLDEVLVKLDGGDGQTFTRTLLSIVDEQRRRSGNARVLITCRTQYFRTLREQSNHFSGQERGNARAGSYRSLVLLPLTEAQVLHYLEAAVPGSRPDDLIEMLRSVHDLTDLAHRPYTLSLVSQFLPEIEADRAAGKTVFGVTLYRRMVARWLERDDGKHHLRPEDKIELAQALAAHLHRCGAGLLAATDLEDWMHEWLDATPRLARRYNRLHPDQLEEDLRTATFLARIDGTTGSGFRFAHTSLAEYFHACDLLLAIDADDDDAWDIAAPSSETLDFLGQLLAERADPSTLTRLTTWGREHGGRVSQLILGYAVAAAESGWPTPPLRGLDLDGSDLQERLVAAPAGSSPLDLREARLRRANLRGAAFRHVDLTEADLSDANAVQTTFSDSSLVGVSLTGAQCTDAAFVRTDLSGVDLSTATGTHPILVGGVPPDREFEGQRSTTSGPGSLIRLRWTGLARAGQRTVAYSPDGTRLASAGDDGTIRIWDSAAGTCLTILAGHSGLVLAVAYSPDGTRLVSTGTDGVLRIWDPTTGTCLKTIIAQCKAIAYSPDGTCLASAGSRGEIHIWDPADGHLVTILSGQTRRQTQAVVYSPDGANLASAGNDPTIRVWDPAGGICLTTFVGEYCRVQGLAYSPDGSHLASADVCGTIRIWDRANGTCLKIASGQSDPLETVAFSPSGSRVASAGLDGRVRIWDQVTGACLMILDGHAGGVQAVAYSPDGTQVASAGRDGTVRIWDTTSGACSRVHGVVPSDALGSYGEAVWDPSTDEVLYATGDAWRCLVRVPEGAHDPSHWLPIDCAPSWASLLKRPLKASSALPPQPTGPTESETDGNVGTYLSQEVS